MADNKREGMDRPAMAAEYHAAGMNCAQAVAGAYADVIGLDLKKIFALTGTFGGGFRSHEICGAITGAAVVLGAKYPHDTLGDMAAKSFTSKKMMEFVRRFRERFPALTCRDLRDIPGDPSVSPAAKRLGLTRSCDIYIVAAVEILEEMFSEA